MLVQFFHSLGHPLFLHISSIRTNLSLSRRGSGGVGKSAITVRFVHSLFGMSLPFYSSWVHPTLLSLAMLTDMVRTQLRNMVSSSHHSLFLYSTHDSLVADP